MMAIGVLRRMVRWGWFAVFLCICLSQPHACAGQDDWPEFWRSGAVPADRAVLDEAFAALQAGKLAAEPAARAEEILAPMLDRQAKGDSLPRDQRLRTGRSWMFLGELLGAQGKNEAMAAAEKHGLASLEGALAADDPELADTLDSHARSLVILGRYDAALGLRQRALAIREQALGPEHPDTATSLNNLATTYRALGRYAEALPLQQRALAIWEQALGPEHRHAAISLGNLASTYSALGRYAEALPLEQRVLAIFEKNLGPEHPNTATALNNLAATYRALGRYAEALPLEKRSLAIREKTLGPEHPDTAFSLNNLAGTFSALGRYAEALPLEKRSLAIFEKNLGPEHPNTATALNNLACTYLALARYAEALPLENRALAIREKTLGPEHPDTAISIGNLALAYRALARYAEALPLEKRALAIREKTLGPEHPGTAISFGNLATTYSALARYAEALPLEKRALAIREKTLGPEHPGTAISLGNLASTYRALARYAEALPLEKRALAIREKTLGPEHPDTAISIGNMAAIYLALGRYAEALPLNQRALSTSEKAVGPEHPDTAFSLGNLASTYRALGRYAEALPLEQRALAIREKNLGPGHRDTAISLGNLALTYSALGRYAEALPLEKRALAIREKTLGPDHPDSLISTANLVVHTFNALDRPADALSLLQPAFPRAAVLDTPAVRIHFFRTYASVLKATAHPTLAIYHGKQAVAALQGIRGSLLALDATNQRAFVEQYRSVYESLAGWLIEAERLPEALEVLGMLKEQEFHEFQLPLRGEDSADPRRTRITWSVPERPYAEDQAALQDRMLATTRELFPLAERARDPVKVQGLTETDQERLAALRQVREGELAEFAAFEARLTAALGGALPAARAALPDTAQSHRLAEIVANLGRQGGQEVVLLHYVVTAERLYVVMQSAEGNRSLSHPVSSAALLQKIVALREAIARPSGDPRPAAQALHADLMAPLAPWLAGRSPLLLLSLTGPLRYVPFAALHDGEHYLVERHPLALLHPAALARVDAPRRADWQVHGFGLSRAVQGFVPLAAVRQELEGIRDLYGSASRLWFDGEFTEASLTGSFARPHPVLHLASHFVLTPGGVTESFLLLGDGSRFSLARARELDFSGLDLLVLSACETAMPGGRDREGREVESFGALAQAQGAGAVLASLWRVSDASTAGLMRAFYAGREAGLSKAEALRQAQLAFLQPGSGLPRPTPAPSRAPATTPAPDTMQVASAVSAGETAGEAATTRGLAEARLPAPFPAYPAKRIGDPAQNDPNSPSPRPTPSPSLPTAPGMPQASPATNPPSPLPAPALGRRHPFFWAPFVLMGNAL